jgi:hypothetical protein
MKTLFAWHSQRHEAEDNGLAWIDYKLERVFDNDFLISPGI